VAKKRFTEGLEDLFSSAAGGSLSNDSPLLRETSSRVKTKSSTSAASQSKSSGTSSSSGKSFSSDLDDWFRDALRESLEKSLQEPVKNTEAKSGVGSKKRSIKPKEGLDTLIRQTIETAEVDLNYEKKRRLVVALDQEVLDKLRSIAQREKSYLKDIVNRVVTEFIDQYEKKP
jgi:hypothetical protein